MTNKIWLNACFAAILSIFAHAERVSAGILYSQPTDFNGNVSSQNDTSDGGLGAFATAYDNFNLGAASIINSVSWTGSYSNPSIPGSISSFTISFFTDNAGQPGALINSETISGNANETFLQNDVVDSPTFSYSADLPTSITTDVGRQYWLSIVANAPLYPQWGWETGTGGDGVSYQDFLGSRSSYSVDLAFSLNGTLAPTYVPMPSTLVLCGLGWCTALLFIRLRRQKSGDLESV